MKICQRSSSEGEAMEQSRRLGPRLNEGQLYEYLRSSHGAHEFGSRGRSSSVNVVSFLEGDGHVFGGANP